jgi:hypothetical protein
MKRALLKFETAHLRTYIAIFLLVIFAFIQSISALQYYDIFYLVEKINKLGTITDPVDKYDKTLTCVEQNLGDEKTVGFITSLTDIKDQRQEKLFQTQYILAPIVVENSAEQKIVIGYYPDGLQTEVFSQHNLKIKRDCGNNLVILEKK